MEYLYEKTTFRFSVFLDAEKNTLVDGLILYKNHFKGKVIESLVFKKEGDRFVIQGDPGKPIQKYNEEVYKNIYDLETIDDKFLKELNFEAMDTYIISGLNELIEDFVNCEIVPASYLKIKGKTLGIIQNLKNKYKLQEKLEE
ncbi:MAG: hypothetical protein ACRCXX_13715 [Cetobacterium sp.]|uniref:hypothetical protein n=1 Tax=Cetobacterium sp. TaxID=2071632 RepID=UPI003F3EA85E